MPMIYQNAVRPDELYHYGVVGMKWGKHKSYGFSSKEIRSDNKTAFKLGKEVTIYDRAFSLAEKKVKKLDKKASNKPTINNSLKLERAKIVRNSIKQDRDTAVKNAYKHQKALVAKYGKEHISDIKTDRSGRVNERVASGKEWIASLAFTGFSSVVGARKLMHPATKNKRAKRLYKLYNKKVRKQYV